MMEEVHAARMEVSARRGHKIRKMLADHCDYQTSAQPPSSWASPANWWGAMKAYQDEALAEVRAACKAVCDRFGNDTDDCSPTCEPSNATIAGEFSRVGRRLYLWWHCAKRHPLNKPAEQIT
jgi:hypothetical protein